MKIFVFGLLIFTFYCSTAQHVDNLSHVNPTIAGQRAAFGCNNWLQTPSQGSAAYVGKVDVPGDKITVEATVYRTSFSSNGTVTDGDLVSKHTGPNDANYILRPTGAIITTTNGTLFATPPVCAILLNKIYHFAMVYDGVTLKFYRNGFLMSQVAASGNLYQNSLNTGIGLYDGNILQENFVGYINEVRIWNVARTQAEIRANMNGSLPVPASQPGLLAYYTFDDLINKQGNPAWNGSLAGAASINRQVPDCTFIPDSCELKVNVPCSAKEDFNYTPDLCNPLLVAFQSTVTVFNSIKWEFDDGTTSSGSTNQAHIFTSAGNHQVTMITDKSGCFDTVTKIFSLGAVPANVIVTPDTIVCAGSSLHLRANALLGACWSPATYLDNPKNKNPTSTPAADITYYLNAIVPGQNLIVNGDFSSGNTGFTSEYNYANPNITEGQYFVGPNPNAWNVSLSACPGHTTGNDNMLLVNGAPVAGVNVWKQTINVVPNTNYAFSTWVQALWPPNPAQLQFSINGKIIGNMISASLPTCTWSQFYTTWNSGNTTTAVISIVNINTAVQGNDFALDDISFAPVIIQTDSVVIKVQRTQVKTSNDTTICPGTIVQLNTSGNATSFNWSPATGLSNGGVANPVATPLITTQYIVSGKNANGCEGKDTVQISVRPKPLIVRTPDTTICHDKTIQLNASGGSTYSWTPATGLSNVNISNPVASPVANIVYYLTVKDAADCSSIDSVKVSVRPASIFSINSGLNSCLNTGVLLAAAGGDTYDWQPATGLNKTNIANPFAMPVVSTVYSVKIKSVACGDSASLSTPVTVLPLPSVKATSSNDIDCTKPAAQLQATGAEKYVWEPFTGLNDSTLANPIASPPAPTVYIVKGTDLNGCSAYDSVGVLVTHTGDLLVKIPNAFTPNGDGKDDCFGVGRFAGLLQNVQLSVYDRFGVKVFYTSDPANCWDGRYKGKLQDAGTFVYILKAKTFCGDIFKKGIIMLLK